MKNHKSIIETKKRIEIINKIDNYVKNSSLSGLIVTGSLAWGKDFAVTSSSDIDFYILAPNLRSFSSSLYGIPSIPRCTKEVFRKMINHSHGAIQTISSKTKIGPYSGTIYLFTEKSFFKLVNSLNNSKSKFFKNLRPHIDAQTKEYKGIKKNKITYVTPISRFSKEVNLWIRTDPLSLVVDNNFYGSIFLSHILFGEIYTDKNNVIHESQKRAQKFLKSILPQDKNKANIFFRNYLPRIERMGEEKIKDLFDSVWSSS